MSLFDCSRHSSYINYFDVIFNLITLPNVHLSKKFVNLRFKREIIMLDKIMALREEINAAIASDMEAVEQLRIKYLSKKGLASSLMADFRSVPADQKREVGQKINELKTFATEKINSLRDAFFS